MTEETSETLVQVRFKETTEYPRPWTQMASFHRKYRDHIPADDGGPWDDEPDFIQWIDPTTTYQCMMKRGYSGGWCGYVCVPRDHPLHGHGYSGLDEDINVHGGLTFADSWLEEGDWWFGFDCGHAFDISPAMPDFGPTEGEWASKYRDAEYVKAMVKVLAAQLFAWKAKP